MALCILIVDDEALVRETVSEYLQGCEDQVLQAKDGRHALEIAAELGHHIRAVIRDIEMPHLSGVEM